MAIKIDSDAISIITNDREGRLVLAARDLKAGETLLVEEPLARFPPFYTKPLCLGCYSFIDKNNHINCPECNFPMCSIECCQYPDHLLECSMFQSCKVKVQAEKFNYDTAEVLYDVITPLRILAYKKTNKEKYEEYMDLMDHIEDFRNRVGYLESHQPVVDYIQKTMKLDVDKETIFKIFCKGYINDFSTKIAESKIRMVFPKTAMISHDCCPNTGRYIDIDPESNNTMRVIAARDISKGEKLSITYVDLIMPGVVRRQHLKKDKLFDCVCSRCEDSKEKSSSISCEKCSASYLDPPEWKCDGCNITMTKKQAEEIVLKCHAEAEELLYNPQYHTVSHFEGFLKEYEKRFLHPENLSMIRIKHSLTGFYGRLPGYTMNDMAVNPALLDRKMELIEDCIRVIEKIEPGISSMKGVLLYELHMPLIIKSQMGMSQGLVDPASARKEFQKAVKCLEESINHLQYEPLGNFENQLYLGAQQSIVQLKGFVSQM